MLCFLCPSGQTLPLQGTCCLLGVRGPAPHLQPGAAFAVSLTRSADVQGPLPLPGGASASPGSLVPRLPGGPASGAGQGPRASRSCGEEPLRAAPSFQGPHCPGGADTRSAGWCHLSPRSTSPTHYSLHHQCASGDGLPRPDAPSRIPPPCPHSQRTAHPPHLPPSRASPICRLSAHWLFLPPHPLAPAHLSVHTCLLLREQTLSPHGGPVPAAGPPCSVCSAHLLGRSALRPHNTEAPPWRRGLPVVSVLLFQSNERLPPQFRPLTPCVSAAAWRTLRACVPLRPLSSAAPDELLSHTHTLLGLWFLYSRTLSSLLCSEIHLVLVFVLSYSSSRLPRACLCVCLWR